MSNLQYLIVIPKRMEKEYVCNILKPPISLAETKVLLQRNGLQCSGIIVCIVDLGRFWIEISQVEKLPTILKMPTAVAPIGQASVSVRSSRSERLNSG